jgi:tetratricopeptide (TPR) repeat protein
LTGEAGWLNAQTATLIAAACLTLAALGLLFASAIDLAPDAEPSSRVAAARGQTSPAPGQPPDLSSMTPREAADRLFNRVMMADERGDREEALQFAPMAVAAYEQLESLDLDALYHLGLIHAAAGELERAEEHLERLKAVVPAHLLASLLEHRLALANDDAAKAALAATRFQEHYDEEIAIERPEYLDHRASIDKFRAELDQN